MIWLNIILGTVLIVTGLILGRYPSLVSWYDLSSDSEKRKYDMAGLSKMYRNISIGIGLLVISINPIFKLFKISEHTLPASFSTIVIGLFGMYIAGELFYKKRE